jgi:hypothetical protein
MPEIKKRTDEELWAWLEKQARESRTGISFDYIPSVEGEPSGWRFMRLHFIGQPKKSLRAAVEHSMWELRP